MEIIHESYTKLRNLYYLFKLQEIESTRTNWAWHITHVQTEKFVQNRDGKT